MFSTDYFTFSLLLLKESWLQQHFYISSNTADQSQSGLLICSNKATLSRPRFTLSTWNTHNSAILEAVYDNQQVKPTLSITTYNFDNVKLSNAKSIFEYMIHTITTTKAKEDYHFLYGNVYDWNLSTDYLTTFYDILTITSTCIYFEQSDIQLVENEIIKLDHQDISDEILQLYQQKKCYFF